MAITVDNSIARVSSGAGATSVTSGTFTALTGQVLLATVTLDNSANFTAPVTPTISNNDAALTWALQASSAAQDAANVYCWSTVLAGDRAGLTVTITRVGNSDNTPSLKLYLLDGADTADLLGASVTGASATNNLTTTSLTPETSGVGIAVGGDWEERGVPTSSDLTISGFTVAGKISGLSGYKALTVGVGATANLDAGGTSAPAWRYLWCEIRAGAGGPAHHPRPCIVLQAVHRANSF